MAPLIKETMEDTAILKKYFGVTLNVPIIAEGKIGPCWGKGEEWK
jgi:hypothetical protein